MKKRILSVALACLFGLGAFGNLPAQAATHYANCTVLHKHYRYGVAKSARAGSPRGIPEAEQQAGGASGPSAIAAGPWVSAVVAAGSIPAR